MPEVATVSAGERLLRWSWCRQGRSPGEMGDFVGSQKDGVDDGYRMGAFR